IRSRCFWQRRLSFWTRGGAFPNGIIGSVQSASVDRERELAREQVPFADGNVFIQPCPEQYGRNRHLSCESVQHGGRVRASVDRCSPPFEPRWSDQYEVEYQLQSACKHRVWFAI